MSTDIKASDSTLDFETVHTFAFVAYIGQTEVIEPLLAGEATLQLGPVLEPGAGFEIGTQDLPNMDEIEA